MSLFSVQGIIKSDIVDTCLYAVSIYNYLWYLQENIVFPLIGSIGIWFSVLVELVLIIRL